jgi:murein DD-endopeptidase MepM/ murein hydrolase activator NlpD
MRNFWLIVSIFALSILLSACGGGGSSKNAQESQTTYEIETANLVSVDSASSDQINVQWLPSSSESVMDVTYEVHVSNQSNFTPTQSTFKLNTTDKEALIEGLNPSTTYYVKIVSKGDNQSIQSLELSTTTSSIETKINSNVNLVINDETETSIVDDTKIETTKTINTGDFIVKQDEGYLRKVVSVESSNGKNIATTEPAAIGEVFSDLEFSTSTKLVNDIEEYSELSTNSVGSTLYQNKEFQWSNGTSYAIKRELLQASSSKVLSRTVTKSDETISAEGDYYKLETPKTFVVDVDDNLKHQINISQLNSIYNFDWSYADESDEAYCSDIGGEYVDGEYLGGYCNNVPVKMCSVQYNSEDLNDLDSNNKPIVSFDANSYFIEWSPKEENVDEENGGKYELDIFLNVGVGDCEGDNKNKIETIELNNISLVTGDNLEAKVDFVKNIKYSFENESKTVKFDNTLSASFTPKLIFSGKFVDSELETATAKVQAIFSVEELAELQMQAALEHTFDPKPIYTKSFTKVVMAGTVPIVLRGQLKFMVVADAQANASLDATFTSNMTMVFDYGIKYDGNEWVKDINNSNFTYDIKFEAEGQAEATMRLKLIPDFQIEVYELAAAHILAEPYLYATAGVDGKLEVTTSNFDANARFNKLETGVGMNLKVYAGAAWDTQFESLKYPSSATYATIGSASFMNSKHQVFLNEYYENTQTYEKFEILEQKPLASIPTIGVQNIDYSAVPPVEINQRAIAVDLNYTNIESYLHKTLGLGEEYYIYFDSWDAADLIEGVEYAVQSTTNPNRFWVVPETSDNIQEDAKLRFVGHSNLGKWARQTTDDIVLNTATQNNYLPTYWQERYTSDVLAIEGDYDNDGYTNYEEYLHGTNPNDSENKPSFQKDTNAPVFTSSSSYQTNENEINSFTIVATDENTIIYSINGTDAEYFNLDSSTGVLSFKIAPDYELKQTYVFNIIATDINGNESLQNITISINDIDESNQNSCGLEKTNHTLASLLFNLDPTIENYDNPGNVTAPYLMENYEQYITGMEVHAGVDFRSRNNSGGIGRDEVYALTSGEVVRSDNGVSFGAVSVRTTNNEGETVLISYGHLDETVVQVGDSIKAGMLIGYTGDTGAPDAPHLHLEYRVNYTGQSMVYNTSCGDTDCSKSEIEDLTDDPVDILDLYCSSEKIPNITTTTNSPSSSPKEVNQSVTFTATLSEALDNNYIMKIELGDGGGGWVGPFDMVASNDRRSFIIDKPITRAGDRVYRVAIFEESNQISPFVAGSYRIIEGDNNPPIANAGIDQTVTQGTAVTLSASNSTDNDGTIMSYEWKEGNTILGTNETLVKSDFSVGTHTITLTIKDDDNVTASDIVIITVNEDGNLITHNGFSYEIVTSPHTGRIWLDRNLGASRVCTSYDDEQCYGDYYQWGRNTDGHEKLDSITTSIQAIDINNVSHGDFIISSEIYEYDWAKNIDVNGSQRNNNWSKIDGSSICPVGFRVPTIDELKAETVDLVELNNNNDAFESFLKFPSAGGRYDGSGLIHDEGSVFLIWSNSRSSGLASEVISISGFHKQWYGYSRANALSVRCIKESNTTNVSGKTISVDNLKNHIMEDNHLYIAENNLKVFDISDGDNIELVQTIEFTDSDKEYEVSDIVYYNNHIYIAYQMLATSDGNNPVFGVKIIDINSKDNITLKSEIQDLNNPLDLEVINNKLYIADDYAGLIIYDISDKENPILSVSSPIIEGLGSIEVYGNYIYAQSWYDNSNLKTIDIADLDDIKFVEGVPSPDPEEYKVTELSDVQKYIIDGNYLYTFRSYYSVFTNPTTTSTINVYDISDHTNIEYIAYASTNDIHFGDILKVYNNKIYIHSSIWGDGVNKIVPIDIANPSSPSIDSLLTRSQYESQVNDLTTFSYVLEE